MIEKMCIGCGITKPLNQYSPTSNSSWTSRCKQCRCLQAKQWRVNNPDKAKAIAERAKPKQREYYESGRGKYQSRKGLLTRYGLTLEQYNAMVEAQGGVCAICGKPEDREKTYNLSVDHCHVTGRIRGLLCAKCNSALGHMEDNITYLQNAISYLKYTSNTTYEHKEV